MNPQFWKGMLIVCVIMLGVLAASYPFLEPGSPTAVVSVIAAVHVLAAMAIIGSLLYFDWDPFEPFR